MEAYSGDYFKTFQYFFGVVEDRDDPERMGRVRVRAFGIHTEDRSKIPTKDLPWATPLMPYTSASISGIGESPTGPVEGTWVVGFFVDGKQMQTPIIMGTLPGAPEKYTKEGFNDPNGVYPRIEVPGESDVNRLARGDDILASTENSIRSGENNYAYKIKQRMTDVPVAGPPGVESDPGAKDSEPSAIWDKEAWLGPDYLTRKTWNEPNPRYGGQTEGLKAEYNIHDVRNNETKPSFGNESKYPLNHVRVTESGHIFEVDDSPKPERIHQYHTSGTFYEVQPNGTRVTKVVGDDYLMVMHDHNMHVSGNVNITVQGHDVRLLVKAKEGTNKGPAATGGNMFIETEGDLKFKVGGNMHTKVEGSVYEEFMTDHATNINKKKSVRVGSDRIELVKGDHKEDVTGNFDCVVTKDYLLHVYDNRYVHANKKTVQSSINDFTIMTSNNVNVKSTSNTNMQTNANLNIDADEIIEMDAGDKIDIDAGENIEITTPKTVDIDGSTEVDIDGAIINLN